MTSGAVQSLVEYFRGRAAWHRSAASHTAFYKFFPNNDLTPELMPWSAEMHNRVADRYDLWVKMAGSLSSSSRAVAMLEAFNIVRPLGDPAKFGESAAEYLDRFAEAESPDIPLESVLMDLDRDIEQDHRSGLADTAVADHVRLTSEFGAAEALLRWSETRAWWDRLEETAVRTLRGHGWSWERIASLMQTSKQTLWNRYREPDSQEHRG